MNGFPALLPADGSLSAEMHLLQGAGHKHAFFNRPPGERFFAELLADESEASVLPSIYEFWLEKLGMTAEFRGRRIAPAGIGEYVAASIADPAWRGCNLCPSLKQAAVPHVSLMVKHAEDMPFVDTLFRYQAGWPAGLTTIGAAFWKAFTSGLTSADSPRIWGAGYQIVGSGAVATTVAAVLAGQRMTNVWIYARDVEAGRRAAVTAGLGSERVLSVDQLRPLPKAAFAPYPDGANVVINATPARDGHAIDLADYPPGTQVIDFADGVPETPLVCEGRRRGFRAIASMDLAIEQAAQCFFFFYLTQAPRQHDAELRTRLGL